MSKFCACTHLIKLVLNLESFFMSSPGKNTFYFSWLNLDEKHLRQSHQSSEPLSSNMILLRQPVSVSKGWSFVKYKVCPKLSLKSLSGIVWEMSPEITQFHLVLLTGQLSASWRRKQARNVKSNLWNRSRSRSVWRQIGVASVTSEFIYALPDPIKQ